MAQSKPGDAPKAMGRCPICTAPSELATRPFCSRRCADVDLHRWLRGGYVIASTGADDDEDGDQADAPATPATEPERDR